MEVYVCVWCVCACMWLGAPCVCEVISRAAANKREACPALARLIDPLLRRALALRPVRRPAQALAGLAAVHDVWIAAAVARDEQKRRRLLLAAPDALHGWLFLGHRCACVCLCVRACVCVCVCVGGPKVA